LQILVNAAAGKKIDKVVVRKSWLFWYAIITKLNAGFIPVRKQITLLILFQLEN
jgi:hypothetical protein